MVSSNKAAARSYLGCASREGKSANTRATQVRAYQTDFCRYDKPLSAKGGQIWSLVGPATGLGAVNIAGKATTRLSDQSPKGGLPADGFFLTHYRRGISERFSIARHTQRTLRCHPERSRRTSPT